MDKEDIQFYQEMTQFLIDKGTTREFRIDKIEYEDMPSGEEYRVYCTCMINFQEVNLMATVNVATYLRWKEDKITWTQPINF